MGIELAIAAAVLAVAAGGYTAYNQIQQGRQQKKMAEYNAAIARNSAVSAKQWADYNERREREKQRYRRGKMMVSFLKNGVTLDEGGSASMVLDEQLVQDEMESVNIRRQGIAMANRYTSQAELSMFEGKQAERQGYVDAGGTLLTTAAQVASIGAGAGGGAKPVDTGGGSGTYIQTSSGGGWRA